MAAALLGVSVNALRPDGVSLFGWRPEPPPAETTGGGETPPGSVSMEEAVRRYESGEALFVDARSEAAFREGHIRDAVGLPADRFDEEIESFFQAVDPDRFIVTYCDGATCPLAGRLADKLTEMGYTNVHYLVDGWGRWREQGLPTEP